MSTTPRSDDASRSEPRLLRVLGPWGAMTVVVGSVIGSGIFLKANVVARAVGRFDLVITVWVVCGLISLLGALASAELGAMLPHAGGSYVYLREAYGPLTAFLWGWTEFWVARTGSTAALAVVFADRLGQLIGPLGSSGYAWARRDLAVLAIVLLVAINLAGARWGGYVQSVTTGIKAGSLILIAVLPFLLRRYDVANLATTVVPNKNLWLGFAAAMAAVFWAYDGWGNIGPVAEEVRDPGRNIPLALIGGLFLLITLYLGATLAYHLVLPMSVLAGIERDPFVAQVALERLLGPAGTTVAIGIVICSVFGALNSNVLTGPRVIFAMARDGLFLAPMRRVHPRWGTPLNAILGEMAWACVLVLFAERFAGRLGGLLGMISGGRYSYDPSKDPFNTLTDFVIFGSYIFYTLAVAAVLVLRVRRPDLPRPYRTWGYPWVPVLFVVSSVGFLGSMFLATPVESVAGLGFIGLGVIAYQFCRPNLVSRGDGI